MPTEQLLVRLPAELARRFRQQIPARARSAFVQRLLESSLTPEASDADPLYQAALAVEQDEQLAAEMMEWDATVADGVAPDVLAAPDR